MAKILVVDDNFPDLETMKEILEGNKHEVAIATNGAQAIDLAHSIDYDLFIVDVKMPTLSGYDMVQLLREKHKGNAKIIFVSIVPKQEVTMGGVDGFIQKPFTPDDFMEQIKSVLGEK